MITSLRIAMIAYPFPPTFAGGARHAIELSKSLKMQGVESFIIAANLENAPDYEVYESLPVYRIKTKEKNRADHFRFVYQVCAKLISNRHTYEIIHLHSLRIFYFLILAVAKLLRKPVVLCPTLLGHDDPMAMKKKSFLWRVEAKMYRFYDKIICKSTAIKNSCTKAGIPQSRLVLIPGAIPCGEPDSIFRSASSSQDIENTRKSLNLPLSSFIVTFVGRIGTRKGCDVLFQAWERLIQTGNFDGYLLLIGPYNDLLSHPPQRENPFHRKFKSFLARPEENRVIFTGSITYPEVAAFLRASDCFVFPSRREGLPKALIEAMSTGLPVISSHIPGIIDDIIETEKDGIIVYERTGSQFAKHVLRIWKDENLRKKLAANSLIKVRQKFSIRKVVSDHLDLYHDLMK